MSKPLKNIDKNKDLLVGDYFLPLSNIHGSNVPENGMV